MTGYIKLFRQVTEWEWYKDPVTKAVFLHILLKANHSPAKWRGIEIGRGECITSIKNLSDELGISQSKIKTAIKRLEKTGELTSKTTNRWTAFSVENYDRFQDGAPENDKQFSKQMTNKSLTNDKQFAINKNKKKKENKENDSSKRKTRERKRTTLSAEVLSAYRNGVRLMSEEESSSLRARAHEAFIQAMKERKVAK